jgi:tetratricopeptide (TPR) repeat protein
LVMHSGPDKYDHENKAKVFFFVSYGLLLAMALCWSVDDSLVYIFFGAAVYFAFLGFYSFPKNKKFQESGRGEAQGESIFADGLKNIFEKHRVTKTKTQRTFAQPTTPESTRRIVFLVAAGIFATFFIFFIGSIISGSSDDESLVYFNTAEGNYLDGNYDSAYLNYRRAWKSNETYAEAMLGYGNVLAIRKQPDSAIIMFDKALEINPDYREAGYAKAATYYNLEKYAEAIGIIVPLLQQHTDYYDAMLLAGDSYYALRQFDEAMRWYEDAYENGGSRSRALCHIMAYIYDTQGDYSRAIDLYKEALSYDSSVVDIYKRLGELLPNEDGNYYRTQAVKLQHR